MTIERDAFFHRLAAGARSASARRTWRATGGPDDLAGVLAAFAARVERLLPGPFQRLRGLYEPRIPAAERNTVAGAARNIARHYDLSNDLFALFLDPTMTYSAAVFEPGDTLEAAQLRKYEALCRWSTCGRADHLLEIGTGWGGLADPRRRGARLPGDHATLSQAQAALARGGSPRRGSRPGRVVLRDYRDLGAATRRSSRSRCSRPSARSTGRCSSPPATGCSRRAADRPADHHMPHGRYLASRHAYSWIHKYVFPGGLIPSREAIDRALHDASSLRVPTPPRSAATTRRRCGTGATASSPSASGCTRSASTARSCGCGSSTWPTARPDSRPARSATPSCGWPAP